MHGMLPRLTIWVELKSERVQVANIKVVEHILQGLVGGNRVVAA